MLKKISLYLVLAVLLSMCLVNLTAQAANPALAGNMPIPKWHVSETPITFTLPPMVFQIGAEHILNVFLHRTW